VSHVAGLQRDSTLSRFAYGVYECKKKSSTSYVWEVVSYEHPDTAKYETITDARDNQIYRIVTIGSQTWMADNLNYVDNIISQKPLRGVPMMSSCYDGLDANCEKYGRLYSWAAAMDSVGTFSDNGKGCGYKQQCSPTYPVRGICPEGWHLPTNEEWNELLEYVGGYATAGPMLKSRTNDWEEYAYATAETIVKYKGNDAYGFAALPGGHTRNGDYDFVGSYNNMGRYVVFWSSSVVNNRTDVAPEYSLQFDSETANGPYGEYRYQQNSVRCIKDTE
jgi:uncharacterized protein (TIGR02145 family)